MSKTDTVLEVVNREVRDFGILVCKIIFVLSMLTFFGSLLYLALSNISLNARLDSPSSFLLLKLIVGSTVFGVISYFMLGDFINQWRQEELKKYDHLDETEKVINFKVWEDIQRIKERSW